MAGSGIWYMHICIYIYLIICINFLGENLCLFVSYIRSKIITTIRTGRYMINNLQHSLWPDVSGFEPYPTVLLHWCWSKCQWNVPDGCGWRHWVKINTSQKPWWRYQMKHYSALLAIYAGNHRSPMNSPHKGQWRGALMFSLICAWINGWINNREAGDMRRHHVHCDVIVITYIFWDIL